MQDSIVVDHLVTVKDDHIIQVPACNIQRGDIITGIIVRIFDDRYAEILSFQFVELFLQISCNNIYLLNPVMV